MQPFIPALFQVGGDEPIIGIDGFILPMSAGSLVARLLEGEIHLPTLLGVLGVLCLHGTKGRGCSR